MSTSDTFLDLAPTTDPTTDGVSSDIELNSLDRFLYVGMMTTGLVGTFGNLFVIIVITKFTKMTKRLSGILILNQSWVDFMYSVPMAVAYMVFASGVSAMPDGQLAKAMYCRLFLTEWFPWGLLLSSSWNLLIINFERYLSVVWPLFHKGLNIRKCTIFATVLVWLSGISYGLFWAQISSYVEDGECMLYAFHGNIQLSQTYGLSWVLLAYFLPLGVTVYFYSHMIKVMRINLIWI